MSTFLLLHGPWHGSWMWYKVAGRLLRAGHHVLIPDLPRFLPNGQPNPNITLDDYTQFLGNLLALQVEPIILVGHGTLGGMVISQTAESWPQNIKKVVYLAAYMPQDGESALEITQRDMSSLVKPNIILNSILAEETGELLNTARATTGSLLLPNLIVENDKGFSKLALQAVKELFYGDCSEEDITLAREQLCAEPLLPFIDKAKLTPTRFGQVSQVYIETTQDVVISPWLQKEMYTMANCQEVFSLQSSHAPFFSISAQLTSLLTSL